MCTGKPKVSNQTPAPLPKTPPAPPSPEESAKSVKTNDDAGLADEYNAGGVSGLDALRVPLQNKQKTKQGIQFARG